MNIGFFNVELWEREYLKKAFPKDTLFFHLGDITLGNVNTVSIIDVLSVFVHTKVPKKILDKLPRLKLIATRSTGFDHIDLEECRKRNIVVSNVPTYGENTVAEHTFALLLSLSRRIVDCVERTRKGSFSYMGLRGFDLKGKTIGIIGGGNIGQHVVRIAKGFEMNTLVFDVVKNKKLEKKLGFRYVSMGSLLKNSDIITLHVPYNKHTHHLINTAAFAKMKKGAILLNTSRGAVVDTEALVKVLRVGKLGGAGLDVLEGEDALNEELSLLRKGNQEEWKLLLEDHLLLEMPTVLITPHNAFNTKEALMRILNVTIDNINAFKKGKKVNVVG
ncbi:hydroxyacid dehydrogenase [Candidatus Woesearchaeota archaeon]|nr:hydroxyacid dehydrogenase [Candidatus Woesearchaeota archaeon]